MLRTWLHLCLAIGTVLACMLPVSPVALAYATPATTVLQATPDPAEATTILMTEYALGPEEITVVSGEVRLRLVNAGIRRHTLTVLIDGVEYSSPEVRPGDAAEWLIQIERPGRYLLWCNEYRHFEKGMGATLVVGAP